MPYNYERMIPPTNPHLAYLDLLIEKRQESPEVYIPGGRRYETDPDEETLFEP